MASDRSGAGARAVHRVGRRISFLGRRITFGDSEFRAARGRNNHLVLAVGDRVTHDKYGLGTVLETKGSGPTATVVIDFGSAGKVRLMLVGGVPMTKL